GTAVQPVEGALHALLETHRSTDILTEDAALERLSSYRLVVVPELTSLSLSVKSALEAFARGGGTVLMSGPHLSRECPDLVGCTPAGEVTNEPTWLPVQGTRAVQVSKPWQPVKAARGTQIWHTRLEEQEPRRNRTRDAVVTRRKVGRG